MPRITAYLTPEAIAVIDARGTISQTLNRTVARYATMMERLLPQAEARFTADEMDALREAMSGFASDPGATFPDSIVADLDASIVAKLRSMSMAEQFALLDSVERHWRGVSLAQEDAYAQANAKA